MRLLLIDKYCPGHFKHLLEWVNRCEKGEHEVVVLSEFQRRSFGLTNFTHVPLRVQRKQVKSSRAEEVMAHMARRAEVFAEAMREVKGQGFIPDLVCYLAANGCGLHVSDIFPNSLYLGVFEWYFHHPSMREDAAYPHIDTTEEGFAPLRMRNMFQLEALQCCRHKIIATAWQRDSYPEPWRSDMLVLPDGVDTDYFSPGASTVRMGEHEGPFEFVTYFSRSLSRDAGLETFFRAMASVFAVRPQTRILLMGNAEGSWEEEGRRLKHLVRETAGKPERVHFTCVSNPKEYRAILRASAVHVFLPTGPLGMSVGLLEAMSCGCLVVAGRAPFMRGMLHHDDNALLVKNGDHTALATGILRGLEGGPRIARLRESARGHVRRCFDAADARKKWISLLSDTNEAAPRLEVCSALSAASSVK